MLLAIGLRWEIRFIENTHQMMEPLVKSYEPSGSLYAVS